MVVPVADQHLQKSLVMQLVADIEGLVITAGVDKSISDLQQVAEFADASLVASLVASGGPLSLRSSLRRGTVSLQKRRLFIFGNEKHGRKQLNHV